MIKKDYNIPAIGTCDICKQNNVKLIRTYFQYPNIKCNCHSPNHFVLIDHCINCIPKEPEEQKIIFLKEQIYYLDEVMKNG